ncbi:Stk1 family PASTA domain-containing Ser/Thr kinase [Lactobacillus pentosus]|uniref:non-specific serine/threonine protein kinase n=1 Tax=Lactiplantibacillus pentosus TaxID=1589 RepID=A0AB37RFH2_LACPE|nr:Stk1 family PASTA domain-containing Ser/Thr kinase [Lactiplantibacillus pentosus]MCH4129689.1 Stk1 family PASTA domain-containing Ser/Thr kinase [Lactiplantibacillus sp.]BBM20211.1 serine/threonine protein kinase [Lactiplantibacillus plantarum]AYJ41826.1 Stk1 family PASTA domain-containing Ser/Thr kinase [Lactiplantibacillus pentosus]MCC3162540.1 Stk1 family PASTA domain-containing Ser/Thr kinase [Lactiplantibacillus pentosus]MCJ8186537.1 Stk1 family PASTA domain-containing Ser/Thr kinase [
MTPNYTLSGRYRIVRSLGEGGMANVYLAHDLILDRDVAVKLLRLDLRDDPKTIKRFQREALATTELVHPHIVSLYDVGEENGMQYLVMEYVKGMDLKNYIKENFPLPLQQVIDIMEQILSAVATAHAHNIIHRDLKPQNILIDEQGNAKITDFGIAVALSEHTMTQTNTILGSVHYLSPEQARGSMATKQSDIYSLGIILYEMLTGSVPFKGETAVSIALKHFQNAMPSVREFDADIPQALENVVLQATTKDPRERYATVEDMAADLLTVLSADRAGEKRFVPQDIGNDETKIMPSADIQAAIAANQDGKTQVVAHKIAQQAKSAPHDTDAHQATHDDDDDAPLPTRSWSKRHPLRRRIIFWGTVVLLLIIAVIVGLELSRPQTTKVPNVAGMSQAAATKVLKKHNLTVGKVQHAKSNQVRKNQVIKSTPAKASKVQSHSRINLVVSNGAKPMSFGNYVNDNYHDVRQTLTSAGFKVKETYSTSSVSAGQIISQDVVAGSRVMPTDTTVTFTVSAGSRYVELKDLTGESRSDILDYARSNDLNINFKQGYSSEQKSGYSFDQDPDGGGNVRTGSTVTVTMSRGSDDHTTPPKNFYVKVTIPYKALSTSSSAANDVKIYLYDDTHMIETVYRDIAIMRSTKISLPFQLTGDTKGRYRIVRNGVTIMEKNNITSENATK